MKTARLLLRILIGGLFFGHGTQKLFGWFGGHGLEKTAAAFESMGMRPGKRNAIAAGVAEAGGGAALALGAATPLATSALVATMLVAIKRVHLKNGPWASNGGYEYNAVLIGAVLALVEAGPGKVSVDAALGHEPSGTAWAAGALAAGIAGAVGAELAAASQPAPAVASDGAAERSEQAQPAAASA
jgi:putative oxidoreductase